MTQWVVKNAPVRVSPGCFMRHTTYQFPNLGNAFNSVVGTMQRTCVQVPRLSPEVGSELRQHCKEHLRRLFPSPIRRRLMTFEEWLELTPYTQAERLQMRAMFENFYPNVEDFKNKNQNAVSRRQKIMSILSFIKAEFYPAFKLFRSIQGRHDLAKILLGPVVKTIELDVYQHPWCIKHVPWAERPHFIRETFSHHNKYTCLSDFTSFEASIKLPLAYNTEYVWYKHFAGKQVATFLMAAFYDLNVLSFSNFTLTQYNPCRASGDACTALGNFIVCVSSVTFLMEKRLGYQSNQYTGTAEGDDNLLSSSIRMPQLHSGLYAELGLIAKLEYPTSPYEASFCGMVFSEADDSIITDPYKVLSTFGWLDPKYKHARETKLKGLIRGKALCILYQYVGCPILQSLALWALRHTRDIKPIFENSWSNKNLPPLRDESRAPIVPVTIERRLLMERVYGIPPDLQRKYEDWFSTAPFTEIPNFFQPHSSMFDNLISEYDDLIVPYENPTLDPAEWCRRVNSYSCCGGLIDFQNPVYHECDSDSTVAESKELLKTLKRVIALLTQTSFVNSRR